MKITSLLAGFIFLFTGGNAWAETSDTAALRIQVEQTEKAFAATMAERDHEAFKTFLAEETIFFSGDQPLRGKQAVADAWQAFFTEAEAPFSWTPTTVEVLDSGTLALSTGPVLDSEGNHIADFQSIWRRETSGRWLIVFDKGARACP